MLAVFVIFGAMVGLFFAAKLIMSGELYLLICTVALSAGAFGAFCWIKKKGVLIW